MSVADEFVKWMVLLMIAAIVATFLATRIAGADSKPALLPPDMDRIAQPMPAMTRPFFPEVGPPLRTNDPNQVLWRIMELHRMGQVDEAIAQWQQVDEMCGAEVWRHVAVAAAYLQAGDLEKAEIHLDAALEMEPQNAPAHYFTGLLRLAQAKGARNWPDMIGPPAVMFISLPAVVPNTRDMFELMAMQELRKAIELAPALDLEAPLAPDVWAAEDVQYLPLVTPTVGDLLAALAADRYPVRAHNVLGMMYTERGLFEEAAEHVDAAAAERMNGPTTFRELGAALEAEERYDDAMRVYMKAFRNGDVNLIPAIKVFINGWKAADGG
jgi:tetratricopeptide (TPR) repeat protein